MALSFGIAIQNFPEGAVISMPLLTDGLKKNKAFLYGVLSGVVEPVAAALTVACFSLVLPILPLCVKFCRRSDDLCGCGRIDSGGVNRANTPT